MVRSEGAAVPSLAGQVDEMGGPRLTTAVIGAGPAGLLFSAVGVLLGRRAGAPRDGWTIKVYDKRSRYVRTHRLRIAREPYEAIQREVQDAGFDAFVSFLDAHGFTPEVNELEAKLLELATGLGLERELLAIGASPGEVGLEALRTRLVSEGLLEDDTCFTVVAADSVHSTVREWVRGSLEPERKTHEQLARLRVEGPDLPVRLGAVDQVRLSKVLGSVVDYRLNKNGFAEVDLFLTPGEHERVQALGATPKEPVPMTAAALVKLRAPLFRAIVEHLQRGAGGAAREVLLQSTFRLEHAVMPRMTFEAPSVNGTVFLVGDAGISLPFQRGMSALAQSALALARTHVALLQAPPRERASVARGYDAACREIVEKEITIVRSRAQIVGTLREIVRLSALLPFPIQSWWLRAAEPVRARDRLSIWFVWNVTVAAAALAGTIAGSVVADRGYPNGGLVTIAGLGIQVLGGIAYHSALSFESGPHRYVRRVWEVQIAAALVAGAFSALWLRIESGRWGTPLMALWWLILGLAFLAGLLVFERVVARWFSRADLS